MSTPSEQEREAGSGDGTNENNGQPLRIENPEANSHSSNINPNAKEFTMSSNPTSSLSVNAEPFKSTTSGTQLSVNAKEFIPRSTAAPAVSTYVDPYQDYGVSNVAPSVTTF